MTRTAGSNALAGVLSRNHGSAFSGARSCHTRNASAMVPVRRGPAGRLASHCMAAAGSLAAQLRATTRSAPSA